MKMDKIWHSFVDTSSPSDNFSTTEIVSIRESLEIRDGQHGFLLSNQHYFLLGREPGREKII